MIKRIIFYLAILIFFFYFLFLWSYKLSVFPGLHGDEAWVGIKAAGSGIKQLTGMTNYTGILELLIMKLSFDISFIGLGPMRAGGVFFNLLGVIIISITMIKAGLKFQLIIFLIFIAQCTLYHSAPRVAWEVNTFTMFFISLLCLSVERSLKSPDQFQVRYVGLFLVVNIMGTYNHILFSALSISMLAGVFLWSLYLKKNVHLLLLILSVNVFNLLVVFLAMRYFLDFFADLVFVPLGTIAALVILELYILKRLQHVKFLDKISVRPEVIIFAIALLFLVFLFTHGVSLFEVLSNYKVMMNFYSYQTGQIERVILLTGAAVITVYFIVFLAQDILKRGAFSLFAFIIICYLGLLSLYTLNPSFRYYISIVPLLAFYIAFKSYENLKSSIPLFIFFCLTMVTLHLGVYQIYRFENRYITPVRFLIGNGYSETSAHFIQKEPLIEILRLNKIDKPVYFTDRYFLEQPILFYKIISPWPSVPEKRGAVAFDYQRGGSGFIFYQTGQFSVSRK